MTNQVALFLRREFVGGFWRFFADSQLFEGLCRLCLGCGVYGHGRCLHYLDWGLGVGAQVGSWLQSPRMREQACSGIAFLISSTGELLKSD